VNALQLGQPLVAVYQKVCGVAHKNVCGPNWGRPQVDVFRKVCGVQHDNVCGSVRAGTGCCVSVLVWFMVGAPERASW
jgi:hypothetical protein